MLIVVPEQNREVATVVDFREVAPMAASKNMFHGNKSLASWVRKKMVNVIVGINYIHDYL